MSLAVLERAFWEGMRGPLAAAEALAARLVGDEPLPALERVFVYRRAYWIRQVEVLEDEFRRLAHRVGHEAFRELATSYLREFPSTEPRIEGLGRSFPAYLEAHPAPGTRRLAALASFEWAEVEALMAPDPPTFTTSFAVPPELFPACTIAFVPSLGVLELPADPLADDPGTPTATTFAVWRRGFAVNHRRLAHDEHAAARAALAGAPVADVCAALGTTSDAAVRASEIFAGWLGSGWIARFVPPPMGAAA